MKKIVKLAVLAIFIIGFSLRFVGTKPGYNSFHSDEGISYSAAVSMIKNKNLDPLRYDYPAMVPLTNYVFFKFVFIPIYWLKYYLFNIGKIIDGIIKLPIDARELARIFQQEILGEREINALFWGRYVTALVSFGSVWALYLLGKNLFGKTVGLVSALLLAVNFRAVSNAHIGLPDTYNAFFLLASLLSVWRLKPVSTTRDYLITGIALGLSFSTKYQFFAFFSYLYYFIFIFPDKKIWWKKLLDKRLFLVGLVMILTFVLLNPYLFINFELAREWITNVALKYSSGRNIFNPYPLLYLYNVEYGPVLFAAVVLGMATALLKDTRKSVFLLGYLAPFFYVTLYYSIAGFYIRNYISITPILMLYAGYILVHFKNVLKKVFGNISSILFMFLLVFSAYPTLRSAAINSYYYTQPWSYRDIISQSKQVLPEGAIVASHPFDPLPEIRNIKRETFDYSLAYSLAEFREEKATYALINMDWAGNNFYGWMNEILSRRQTWWKPVSVMRRTFWGVTIEEMLNYTIVSSFKPWQAPDAALFLVKVPDFKKYTFNLPELISPDVLTSDTSFVKADGGIVFRITALVNSSIEVPFPKRDGYVQVDFLADKDIIASSVSQRYFGVGTKELVILAPAPVNTTNMRLRFMFTNSPSDLVVSIIKVEKSVQKYQPDLKYQTIIFNDYRDLLYPNSHGNL